MFSFKIWMKYEWHFDTNSGWHIINVTQHCIFHLLYILMSRLFMFWLKIHTSFLALALCFDYILYYKKLLFSEIGSDWKWKLYFQDWINFQLFCIILQNLAWNQKWISINWEGTRTIRWTLIAKWNSGKLHSSMFSFYRRSKMECISVHHETSRPESSH